MRHRHRVLISLLCLFPLSLRAAAESPDESYDILQGYIEEYRALERYISTAEIDMTLFTYGDIPNSIAYVSDILVEEGRGFSVINRFGLLGRSIIANTDNMWIHIPSLNRYTLLDSPGPTFEYLAADPYSIETLGIERFLLFSIVTGDITPSTSTLRMSAAELEGESHLLFSFKEGEGEYEVWIDTHTGIIRRLNLSTSQYFEEAGDPVRVAFEYSEVHKGVEFDSLISEDAFSFIPGPHDEHAEHILPSEQPSEILYAGEVVPGFTFTPFGSDDKKEFYDLLPEEKPFILYFMEAGSDDSERMSRILEGVYREKDIGLLSVVVGGSRRLFSRYMDGYTGNLMMAHDQNSEIAERFRVERYPTIFLISGMRVRQIYTDFFPGIEDMIREEINSLYTDVRTDRRQHGFDLRWRLDLKVSSLTSDNYILATTLSDELFHIDSSGRIRNRFPSPSGVREILRAGDNRFAGYSARRRDIKIFNAQGDIYNTFHTPSGINQLSYYKGYLAAALSGPTGIQIINIQEEEKVKTDITGISEAVSVSMGDLARTEGYDVIAVDGSDKIMLFDLEGEAISGIRTPLNPDFIMVSGRGSLLLSGASGGNQLIALVDTDAVPVWEMILGTEGASKITSVSVHPLNDWVAVGTLDGQVFLFDMRGSIVGYLKEKGLKTKVEWFEVTAGQYALAVATTNAGLALYNVTE